MDDLQKEALRLAIAGHNICVVGTAGTGKSFLLQTIVTDLRALGKTVTVGTPTGVAATVLSKVGARTIHSICGMLDGRYSSAELVSRVLSDESCISVKEDIRAMDVYVIDEVSMISETVFEKMGHLLQQVRDNDFVFGGVQVILVLDPKQLPPIADPLYQDTGRFAFQSALWKDVVPHLVRLHIVYRQQDPSLSQLIQESFNGCLSKDSRHFLDWLSRPLSSCLSADAVRLYAENIDVDIYNRTCLDRVPGQIRVYEAHINNGTDAELRRLHVQQKIAMKIGSRVMLLTNLDVHSGLVNGSRGVVKIMRDDDVVVAFDSGRLRKVLRHNFTRYDPNSRQIVATRRQFPLKLYYAATIHKCQGLQMAAVEVDARKVRKPGMLAVALSRVRHVDNLRVLNGALAACPKPPDAVLDFIASEGLPAHDGLECCRHTRLHADTQAATCPPEPSVTSTDQDFSLGSDFPQNEEELTSEEVQDLPSFISRDLSSLQDIRSARTVTEEQRAVNSLLEDLPLDKAVDFLRHVWHHVRPTYDKAFQASKVSAANQTLFQRTVNEFCSTDTFKQLITTLCGNSSAAAMTIAMRLVSKMNRALYRNKFQSTAQRQPLSDVVLSQIDALDRHQEASSKIRYVGGSVIGRLKYRSTKLLKNHLSDVSSKTFKRMAMRNDLLQSITGDLDQETRFPGTMKTIHDKLRGRLIPLTDECYLFFIELEKYRLRECNYQALVDQGGEMPANIIRSVLLNAQLQGMWCNLFSISAPDDVSSESGDVQQLMHTLIQGLLLTVVEVSTLRTNTICLYMKTGFKTFCKTITTSLQIEKKEAHRRNLQKRQAKAKTADCRTESTSICPRPSTSTASAATSVERDLPQDEMICTSCGVQYRADGEWVECDGCDGWFCRKCTNLNRSKVRWKSVCDGIEPWFCYQCNARLKALEKKKV